MSDLYRVLGVDCTAKAEQIGLAFRKLAMTCHPDLCGGDKRAELRFREVRSAYEILNSPARRATYDEACGEARLLARGRLRRAAATMAASFVLTVSSGSLFGVWLIRHALL